MSVVPQIAYRDVQPSDALDRLILDETEKLERFYPRIMGCRVLVEHMHRRHRTGSPFKARIAVSLPGEDIFINQGPDVHSALTAEDENENPPRVQKSANVDAAFKDPALAVRSAFKKARRQIQDYVRVRAEAAFRY